MKRLVIRPFMVFNGEYEDMKMNRDGVINTSKLMEETLFHTNNLHYDKNKAVVINNGRRTDVFRKLRQFAGSIDVENEMLLFYFCGHGCPDYVNNKLYLAMKDTDFDYVSDNGIAADAINEIIANYHIKYYDVGVETI